MSFWSAMLDRNSVNGMGPEMGPLTYLIGHYATSWNPIPYRTVIYSSPCDIWVANEQSEVSLIDMRNLWWECSIKWNIIDGGHLVQNALRWRMKFFIHASLSLPIWTTHFPLIKAVNQVGHNVDLFKILELLFIESLHKVGIEIIFQYGCIMSMD